MPSIRIAAVGAAFAAGLVAAPPNAGELTGSEWAYVSDDQTVVLRGSIGAIGIEAREYVFAGSGSTDAVSLLIWQSTAPLATVEIKGNLPDNWTVAARARAAIAGDSYMEDYDWFGPDFVSYDFDDWTHRSQHENTNLDWYLDASLEVGRNLVVEEHSTVNLNAGFKYSDVQWTAIGGSYVYSDMEIDNPGDNFRDYVGTFPDEPGITYRQQLPAVYAGLDTEMKDGPWTFNTGLQAGVVLFGKATDHHWLTDERFVDYLRPTPMLNIEAGVTYDVSDNVGLHLTAALEKVFLGRADTDTYDIPSGSLTGSYPDGAGAEFGTVSISAGLTGRF